MGLAWQQGPLAPGAIGRFLAPHPLPERLLYAEPLGRRMRVRFGADARRAAWSYENAWTEVRRVSGLVSFEADKVEVYRADARLRPEPGYSVIPHDIDRDLTLDKAPSGGRQR